VEVYDWKGECVAKVEYFEGTKIVCIRGEFIAFDVSTEYGAKDEISSSKGVYYFIA
jgi:hypothetical protein